MMSNVITIRPDYRELMAETFGCILVFCVTVGASPYIIHGCGMLANVIDVAVSVCMLFFITGKYIVLRNVIWTISDETICRRRGVLKKQKDYIELYRVVDYAETQTLLQRIFGVKTVSVISTDKTDRVMRIYGATAKKDYVRFIRNKVEQCKKEKRIYEITNN